jgi:hypothetical protein
LKKFLALIAFSVLLLIPGFQNAFADTWDFSDDFDLMVPQTGGTGPTASWFYYFDNTLTGGFAHDGDYDLFDTITLNFNNQGIDCFQEGGGFYLVCRPSNIGDPVLVHPDGATSPPSVRQDVVIGFKSPQAGTYHVEGSFTSNAVAGDGVCVSITKHDPANTGVLGSDANIPEFPLTSAVCNTTNPIDALHIGAGSSEAQAAFDFNINLICNEQLFFRINPNSADNSNDGTWLAITINDIVFNPNPNDDCADPSPPPGGRMPVGGEMIPLETTMVLLAGTQLTAAWLIPVIVAGIGFAIIITRKF